MAESLIPMHSESDPYWVDAARSVFSSVAYRMRSEKSRSIEKLLSLILNAKLPQLERYLQGTQAEILVSEKIEKTVLCIRSVLSTYLKSLRFLQGLEKKESFSIHRWMNTMADAKKSHFLFISSNARQHAAFKTVNIDVVIHGQYRLAGLE